MINELSIGEISEENKGKEIHPERKLSDEQKEKLQETKEVFDKQCQFIINGLENNTTLPDFYKDSSNKLDEILKGVVEKSDDPEVINNLVEAINVNRKIFVDHFESKSNTDFFNAVDNAKSEKGENLEIGKVEANNPEECINSILNREIDYQKTREELERIDKEITRMIEKMTIKPLALQHRIAKKFLEEAEKGDESKKIVFTAMAKNVLKNYKVMIQSPDMRKVLNIDSFTGEPILESDKLEEELKEFNRGKNKGEGIEKLLKKKEELLKELKKIDRQIGN